VSDSKREKPKTPEPGQLWTVPQIAHKLQLSQSTVIRMITAGSIAPLCVRSGKRKKTFRVRDEVLQRWIAAQERQSLKKRFDEAEAPAA
jgi:DNA-binding transcriptional regulator GbsR (MarR family)